ncbi:phosphoribosyl-AMP cyclohydrolase [Kangiella sediminilitoris]|uniref:Histidine biosynthesis bifunctional protein HisIE n=1 Tax=Kangiella sediminilitoris TaxID=1144748 RepID=A0A1B3BBR6_9GAMM|nr:phosphoribosyl-AMP cyclohydrolase [Kangiella sediminilitoris]AOE50229.1 Phosphoribosyl-ATP diphosphatase [Kangiella sediminilitoris]
MLIPSIDLLDGKAVQLEQGNPDRKIVEESDVFGLLEKFSLYGEVAIIDLDAALGRGSNKDLIKQLIKRYPCRVGGGIRDYDTAREYLSAGAKKVILGTSCRSEFVKKLPASQLIFAIDAKGDDWVTHGWQSTDTVKVLDLISEIQSNCSEFLYTQVQKEGLLKGVDRERIEQVIKTSKIPVTVAGGITTLDDVEFINKLGANSQIGMSVYTGRLSLEDALFQCLDFNKSELIPTVVQDAETSQVLMLAYSSENSLREAFKRKAGVYYSRSRQELWEKGLTSGNTQELVNVDYDCDGDTLLFKVRQSGNACHFERYSCFATQDRGFDLNTLNRVFEQRLDELKSTTSPQSFTQKLFSSEKLQIEKLNEECQELIEASDSDEVRWEAADLIFFALVNAKAKGVSAQEIISELGARNAG